MEENNKDRLLPPEEIPGDDIPLPDEDLWDMPELDMPELLLAPENEPIPVQETAPVELDPVILVPAEMPEEAPEEAAVELAEEIIPEVPAEPDPDFSAADPEDSVEDTAELPLEKILEKIQLDKILRRVNSDGQKEEPQDQPPADEPPAAPAPEARYHSPRKGRPKRKGGYGLFGLPHLAATLVWLGIIVMIGTSLGRMIWVCAADVLAFGRESKQVTVTITSHDTMDDIARKLHEAELIHYPEVFKLYAKLAVDDGDILPGTFQLDTIYDYHALVVQMGPRSSTRSVVEDLLIPEGLNCRQIFELLEEKNICTVRELEEYAANGEFSDFWFLEGVERGDKYCLEGFLFPDTYDFYEHSTPREALGKMLLGFEARVNQEETMAALTVLNERLSGMMRSKGCSDAHIAENQLELRDLLIVASLIEEETASSKESPLIASVIYNRLTEDQMYERYLGIDAAIIYATGDADNIDTSIDHPYNTYKYAGLTPGPISNPGLDSIHAALNFEDSEYYYYVLNPETDMHQFSKTLAEHEQWVEHFRGMGQ